MKILITEKKPGGKWPRLTVPVMAGEHKNLVRAKGIKEKSTILNCSSIDY